MPNAGGCCFLALAVSLALVPATWSRGPFPGGGSLSTYGAAAPETPWLTRTIRDQVIDGALRQLEHDYVFPETATRMVNAVRASQKGGEYDRFTDPDGFAAALTDDLREVSKDLHLRVVFGKGQSDDSKQPAGAAGKPPLVSGERLDGNIGYIRLDGFPPRQRLEDRLDPLMETLSTTDALVIDLRENRGGSPTGVMYLAGYLVASKTLVARIYSRPDERTTEMWTEDVRRSRYLDKPVYILTSKATFSAAEAAAYHLKHMGRAKTVGETTGGGAHRVDRAELGHGFWITVPITRPISVFTNTDWEGAGVIPDIPAAAGDALTAAHLAALERLPSSPERTAALERVRQAKKQH